MYANEEEGTFEQAVEQLNRNVKIIFQHCVGDEVLSRPGGEGTHLVEVPWTGEKYLYVDRKRFFEYICSELGAV